MVIEEHAALDVITKDGSTYAIDESQIIRGSLTTSQSCSSGGGIPAGSCNTGTASVAFHAPSALPYEKLFGAKVKLYVWYGDTSKKQVGVYNVTSTERSYGVYTLSLSDNVYLLDEACYSNDTTTAAQNWLAMQLGEKRVPSVIFNMICNAYKVPHWNAAKNEKAVPESGISALSVKVPSDCCTESVKDFANYLAEYLGAIIMPDENGELHFAYMGSRTCPITIDASNIERDTYQKSPFHVSTSSWRVNHDSGIWSEWRVVGDLPDNAAPLSIVVNNNPFWQSVEDGTPESMVRGRTETMLRYMWVAQGKVAYIDNVPQINPFRCTVHVPYYFRAGDRVKIIDPITSEVYHSYVTDVTWTFRGGQQISCAGEDTRTLSVSTSRNGAKKMSDYSRYLYRKSKSNTGSVEANTYTKAEIDAKDAAVKSAADKAQGTADSAVSVNNTQNTKIAALQKSAHTHSNKTILDATTASYTTAEKTKLSGIESGAKKNVQSDWNATSGDAFIKNKPTIPDISGKHDKLTAGTNITIDGNKISAKDTTYSDATQSTHGLMTAEDKKKLDGIADGATKVVVDSALSDTSTNPVENQAITKELAQKADKSAIPTVGDGVLSVQRNGKSVGTFSANAAENASINIPVPEKVSELENDAGYGTYTKPTTGIPKSDLASGVQASLGKADTALQKHQDISGKLDKTGDASNTTVAFSASSARENVKTGEKLSVILGKIAKWFSDLKNVAFTGSYNDLSDVPEEYKHPTYEENSIGFYKFANDGLGHVSDAEKVTKQDIVDLGIPGSIPIYNVDVDEEYGYSEGMIIATIVVNQTAHTIGVPIIGENENADYGLMSASDKTKLDCIADNANNYVHPTTSGNKHIPAGGSSGQILRWSADGTAVWGADNNTTYGDATQSTHGLMTAADKKKLDGMDLTKYLPKDGTAEKAKAMSDGTLRSGFYVNIAANATSGYVWFRMATCKISGAYEAVNTTFLITNGMEGHALLSCGIRNNGTGKAVESCLLWISARNHSMPSELFRVVAINSDTGVTYELWGQITARWKGVRYTVLDERNISGGKYNRWILEDHLDADAKTAPTNGDYFINSVDISVCATAAKATEAATLTDSGWIATTRDTTFTVTSTVKCRKYGQLVEVRGEVTFSDTCGSPTVCTLPAGYRPATVVQACGITPNGKQYMIKADTSGVISFGSDSGSTFVKGTTYRVDLTYLLG